MDRAALADFLRSRRAALTPAALTPAALTPAARGSASGTGRKNPGLRREDVAELAHISTDYYTRLEQRRGPRPSPEVAAALAQALALTPDERDHLFVLIGHNPPVRVNSSGDVDPALRRVLDAASPNPALITSNLGWTLAQNPSALALFGDQTRYTGLARSGYYRWFTMPEERACYPRDIHADQSRVYAASIRAAMDFEPGTADAAELAELVRVLRARSPEFAGLWDEHDVHACRHETTSLLHPSAGRLDFDCEVVFGDDRRQRLLLLTLRGGGTDPRWLIREN